MLLLQTALFYEARVFAESGAAVGQNDKSLGRGSFGHGAFVRVVPHPGVTDWPRSASGNCSSMEYSPSTHALASQSSARRSDRPYTTDQWRQVGVGET